MRGEALGDGNGAGEEQALAFKRPGRERTGGGHGESHEIVLALTL